MTHDLPDEHQLRELLQECRSAQAAPAVQRVSLVLDVFPRMVDALDHVVLYRTEFADVRRDMTMAMRAFREAAWRWEREHGQRAPTGDMQAAWTRLNTLARRAERLLGMES